LDPQLQNAESNVALKFKRRFRFPYPAFQNVLLPMCASANVFNQRYNGRVPLEFKLLISLRILGRGNVADDLNELSEVGASTCNTIFKTFVTNFSCFFFDEYVKMPQGDRLQSIMRAYERLGMVGCIGSMDCTHLWWNKCPDDLTNLCKGKEGVPSMSFECIVGCNKEIYSCSDGYPGTYNDKNVARMDTNAQKMLHGAYKNVSYRLFDGDGVPRECFGAYLIVDGGYQKVAAFMDPSKNTIAYDETLFAE